MEIPDLYLFPPGHPPSPYPVPIAIRPDGFRYLVALLPGDVILRAVGWLGDRLTAKGCVPSEFIDRLFAACESGKVISDGTAGWHTCEICATPEERIGGRIVRWRDRELFVVGHAHHLVRLDKVVYMSPRLILHYVLDHEYQPPSEFVKAVMEGAFLTKDDLVHGVATFDAIREALQLYDTSVPISPVAVAPVPAARRRR